MFIELYQLYFNKCAIATPYHAENTTTFSIVSKPIYLGLLTPPQLPPIRACESNATCKVYIKENGAVFLIS